MSRLILLIWVQLFRSLQAIGRYCDLFLSKPLPPRSSFIRSIDSTTGSVSGKFKLYFYTPPTYSLKSSKKFSLLVNFHGGGYTIGHATDDARFFSSILAQNPDTVICSVDYRLAPTYPFPTGINDCVSAVLYCWNNADELNLDISRTAISGFSAGGNFCFAVAYKLHDLLSNGGVDRNGGELSGIIAFYPALDWTKTRAERAASNPNFKALPMPPFTAGLMDRSYLYPEPKNMGVEHLSPGLASDDLLRHAIPENVCLFTCWGDALLAEGERFRERLKSVGKRVEGYTVPGVVHGWDKWPSWGKVSEATMERDEAYGVAGKYLKELFG